MQKKLLAWCCSHGVLPPHVRCFSLQFSHNMSVQVSTHACSCTRSPLPLVSSSIVFHLAALIGIPYSYNSPLAYIRTNVEGTYNVLESAKNLGIEQVLVTSTSETYGTAQYSPIDEKHPLVGQSPYSASKIASDQFSISYYKSFELPIKLIRPFNVFGPRQSSRAVIPTIIQQCLSENNLVNLVCMIHSSY